MDQIKHQSVDPILLPSKLLLQVLTYDEEKTKLSKFIQLELKLSQSESFFLAVNNKSSHYLRNA
jgi:hypothetical protein